MNPMGDQFEVQSILQELSRTVSGVDMASVALLSKALMDAKRIFVAGSGRSGLMMRAFTMRLMHMDFSVFVVGDTTTPAIGKDDLLVIGSGSGETGAMVVFAEKAKALGARVALLTTYPDSTIGRMADVVVRIHAPARKSPRKDDSESIQPMGSLFEQSLLIVLDGVILEVMLEKPVAIERMVNKHANLE
jgi:6-phospho-3-hexuloisomerase